MAVGSADVNRLIRRVLHPTLHTCRFDKVQGLRAWRYLNDGIWALELRSVGNSFGRVTGFPPISLCGELCIFFDDFPSPDPGRPADKPPCDTDGRYIPKPQHCQIRYPLKVELDQAADRASLSSQSERDRDDVWFVRPDGSNMDAVVEDIRRSIVEWGIPLLEKPYNSRAEQMRRRGLS